MSEELKQCPCGDTPDTLDVMGYGQGGKYALVTGGCCGEWMIEFNTHYNALNSDECRALAIAAWNETPRKERGE